MGVLVWYPSNNSIYIISPQHDSPGNKICIKTSKRSTKIEFHWYWTKKAKRQPKHEPFHLCLRDKHGTRYLSIRQLGNFHFSSLNKFHDTLYIPPNQMIQVKWGLYLYCVPFPLWSFKLSHVSSVLNLIKQNRRLSMRFRVMPGQTLSLFKRHPTN